MIGKRSIVKQNILIKLFPNPVSYCSQIFLQNTEKQNYKRANPYVLTGAWPNIWMSMNGLAKS